MEARGYKGGEGRSRYRQLKWKLVDSLAICFLFLVGYLIFILKS